MDIVSDNPEVAPEFQCNRKSNIPQSYDGQGFFFV